ncbi:MAG TPA: DUF1109 domain-containing protein [Steroidobacteraceae bacterium]|nr:DUF1109 domain-containing protein [Steroidobacteraceae bacterium]
MQTSDLIKQLSTQVTPVRQSYSRRFLLAWMTGTAASLLLLVLTIGVRGDLGEAVYTWPFWMKWLYTIGLGIVGMMLSLYFARPDNRSARGLWWLLVPVALLSLLAVHELQDAPPEAVHRIWMGHSALMCPWNIFGISIPAFIAVMWMMRKLAPTQLRLAGFAAGCLAGASGATVYALLCNESTAPFVVAWYSLGMLLPGLLGALIGPKVLRW